MLNVKVAAAIIMMVIFVTSEGIQLDPLILSKKVQDLVENSLKRKELQDHLDSLSYDTHTVDGADLLNKMVDAFGRKFHERIATVKRLQRVVVSAYSGPPAPAAECCNLTGATYNARYAKEISLNKACVETSNKAEKDLVHLSTAFQDACIQNAKEVPSLRWQYFGSEDGALTIYPATILNSCNDSDFDIRFSPWYVKATVPNSKQVVIVIDKSSSMKKMHNGVTLMKIAIEAAKSVIAALNPRDEFAVLAFSTIAEQMQGLNNKYNCFATTLARATSQNKDKIYIQLDKVEAEGGTNYGTAIDSAFEFLETEFLSNDSDPSAYRVILFMSDGEPSDTRSSILFKLKNRNERLNNSTVILTYGLGDADFSILREMATYNGNPDKRGVFTSISDPSNLKHKMTSFYKYFASGDSGSLEPFWTFPYTDWIGSERMMTATLPVHVNNVLIGVVGVDLTISELLTESFYFKPNEFTYSFVIDGAGLIVTHPFFPKTSSYSSLFIPVTAVETDYDFLEVLESMKRGEAGNKTFLSTRIITFGDNTKVSKYGVREVQISSVYLWKRIPSTEFSVCVVYAVDDVQTELQTQNAVTSDGFTPLDLFHLVPPKNPCNHLNLLAVKDQAALALAPQTFKYPEKHFKHENVTKKDVDEIQQYLIDGKENAHDLKDGVRDAVVAVQKAQELWVKGGDSELQKQVVWRYVGLANGVTLIYPGNQAPSLYDPVARPWYQHAVANRNRNTISPPYLDLAIVETLVTTISRTLFDGRANNIHDAGTEVFGVMGVDLLLPYFHEIFLEMYPVCSNSTVECILLDMAGYIVLADQYVRDGVDAKNFKITHIAEKLPEITTILIESNVLKRINCSVTENSLVQRTYQIADNQSLFEGKFQNATDACIGFELIPVPTSNVFILVQFTNEPSCTESTPRYPRRCNCRNSTKSEFKCVTSWKGTNNKCECPCVVENPYYSSCLNEYQFSGVSPCAPEIEDLAPPPEVDYDLSHLPVCYPISFYFPSKISRNRNIHFLWLLVIIPITGFVAWIFWEVKVSEAKQKARIKHWEKQQLAKLENEEMTSDRLQIYQNLNSTIQSRTIPGNLHFDSDISVPLSQCSFTDQEDGSASKISKASNAPPLIPGTGNVIPEILVNEHVSMTSHSVSMLPQTSMLSGSVRNRSKSLVGSFPKSGDSASQNIDSNNDESLLPTFVEEGQTSGCYILTSDTSFDAEALPSQQRSHTDSPLAHNSTTFMSSSSNKVHPMTYNPNDVIN